jgi:predicted metal-dependent phosphoesterase TrpH
MGPIRFPESVSDPADVVLRARSAGLNVVCITDHNSIAGARKAREAAKNIQGIEVVMGEEVSTADGEVIALYIEEEIPAGLSAKETIARIRSQNGVVIAPHPFSLHCPCLRESITELGVDGIEVLNGGHLDDYANPRAEKSAESGIFAKIGGSDSHHLETIGSAYTAFEGSTAEDLRREILAKRTSAGGKVFPMVKAIAWSVGVVLESDRLIIRSFLGLDKAPTDDPILWRVQNMKLGQKLGALFGSLVYFLPPVPFIIGWASQRILDKRAEEERSANEGSLSRLGPFY